MPGAAIKHSFVRANFPQGMDDTPSPVRASPSDSTIHEAEIVFNSTRFYGHKTSKEVQDTFVEIRGYKWGESCRYL